MDLSNPQNWLLVTDQIKTIRVINQTLYLLDFTDVQVTSPVLMVALDSYSAKPHWRRGGYATLFGQVNGRQSRIGDREFCELFQNNYLKFPYLGEEVIPFTLRIDYPSYLKDISVQVWQYIDQSGKYISPELEPILGETLNLTLVDTDSFQEGNGILYQSRFEGFTKYSTYEVGRFKRGNQTLSDPIIQAEPGKVVAIFTNKEPMPMSDITVTVKPV